jgi:hypothetical protein|tara:strand:+ start:180 stop:578 length:399 start_codon:yes stop_codon:yes gene_type:complete
MIEDDFYATLKLKSGEEIFCKVASTEEEDETLLLVSHPIIVSEVKGRVGIIGYKVEPWLKTTTDDMFLINIKDILTMSESSDVEMISMHQSFVRKNDLSKDGSSKYKLDRKMGYIANINDAKDILEKIYKIK